MHGASGDGRGFAVSGGVAAAVRDIIREIDPEREVKMEIAEGLDNCRKLLLRAKAGQLDGYLLEGMACPGGCVAGAGTLLPITTAKDIVKKHVVESTHENGFGSGYKEYLESLEERYKG